MRAGSDYDMRDSYQIKGKCAINVLKCWTFYKWYYISEKYSIFWFWQNENQLIHWM
jgi:hypothetical protein